MIRITPDLRILLVGASGGIGAALARRWACAKVTRLSRLEDGFDLTDAASVADAASRIEGPFDLIFDATGALQIAGRGPEKALAQIDPPAMAAQFALNAIGPALLIKHFAPKLRRDGPTVFATLSARVGSIGDNHLGGWISYRASKAALNQIVRTASIEIARTHKQACVVALHPGTVATPLTQTYLGRHRSVTPDAAAENLTSVLEKLSPDHTGGFFDTAFRPIPW